MHVDSIWEKGGVYDDARPRKAFSLSFDVSKSDWYDLAGQVRDAIVFWDRNETELRAILKGRDDIEAVLDFPVWSRIDANVYNQNDQFPKELVVRAGHLGLALELATYARDLEVRLPQFWSKGEG